MHVEWCLAQVGASQPGTPSPVLSMLPMVMIFVIFYVLLVRPQRKRQKEHARLLTQLQKNDEVVTSGGIYGTVLRVKDGTVVIRVDDNVKLEVRKSAVEEVRKSRTEVTEPAPVEP